MNSGPHSAVSRVMAVALLGFACWRGATPGLAAAPEQLIQTNQPGRMITKENQVEYIAANRPAILAPTNQWLDFNDALHTLPLSRATVRLTDWTQLYLKDRSRLEIVRQPVATNAPSLELQEGEMYLSSRGGAQSIPVKTRHAHGTPKGTEFLVRVEAGVTEFTMFDGEVEVVNALGRIVVPSGWQGVAEAGQPPRLLAKIEAKNLVQWWIYYPGILDAAELRFTAVERTQLAASLAAYQSGDLLQALAKYPGYPVPAEPATDAQRFYLAGLLLAVGSVDRAEAQLSRVGNTNGPMAVAFRTMIAAVTGNLSHAPAISLSMTNRTATGFLAQSYAHQSTNNLEQALLAARAAATNSPDFGFAWARVGELEFSFGHTRAAREAIQRALVLSPRNAQAHALNGFLLAAEHRIHEALAEFDQAIAIDPALGNAWLGRGLCQRRLGMFARGERFSLSTGERAGVRASVNSQLSTLNSHPDWLSDLQTAAILEPRRSLFRSYAGKAFGDIGDSRRAAKEFNYAIQLDANDPTPWLYSALEKWQENRVNEAVRDLEHSIELNDNRAVYRSRLLLDQDQATRSASLAKIYQSAGLDEVALREAAKAVSYDYASHSAHQFLAESYNALRDPTRFNLRYETVWFNELLLANLLSPVGAGLLSQNISQQEYSRLFEANRVGLLTSTEYRSDGQFREITSHYGQLGRTSYTLDLDYQHNSGTRPNNDLDRIEWYSQIKHQLTDRDSIFLLTKFQDYEAGDNFQHYDPAVASKKLRFTESQPPIILTALHREWKPGLHTTLLAGRLQSDVTFTDSTAVFDLWTNRPPPGINWVRYQPFNRLRTEAEFSAWIGELNQIWQTERHITIAGGRFQAGDFKVSSVIDGATSPNAQNYFAPPIRSSIDEPFQRASLYGYHTWELWNHFRLTGGLSYDRLSYPENFRSPLLTGGRKTREELLPKAAVQWDVQPALSLRGMYAQSLGGLSFDESVRLEPTQLAGFSQSFRNLISEAEAGSVAAPKNEIAGLALDGKLSRHTFIGLEARWLQSDAAQTIGVFHSNGDLAPPPRAVSASTTEKLHYEERSITLSINQLLGDEWSVGAAYQLADSRLRWVYPGIPASLPLSPSRDEEALLHRFNLRLQYQHSSGFFARTEGRWFLQDNDGYGHSIYSSARADESAYQVDLIAGWRFFRRRMEVTVGCLNVTGQDYRLNSLTPYADMPRERVWTGRLRIEF